MWQELSELDRDDLFRVASLYSNYVNEYMEKNIADTGCKCSCLTEFYDNEYQDILQAEDEGTYDPVNGDVWEFWAGYEDD